MKQVLCIFLSLVSLLSFSQDLNDLGILSFDQTKKMNSSPPCEETTNKYLQYCVEDGSNICYTFNNYQKLNGIIFMKPYGTKSQAERAFENDVLEFSNNVGKQAINKNGKTFFSVTSELGATFEVTNFNGTFYVIFSSLLLN